MSRDIYGSTSWGDEIAGFRTAWTFLDYTPNIPMILASCDLCLDTVHDCWSSFRLLHWSCLYWHPSFTIHTFTNWLAVCLCFKVRCYASAFVVWSLLRTIWHSAVVLFLYCKHQLAQCIAVIINLIRLCMFCSDCMLLYANIHLMWYAVYLRHTLT